MAAVLRLQLPRPALHGHHGGRALLDDSRSCRVGFSLSCVQECGKGSSRASSLRVQHGGRFERLPRPLQVYDPQARVDFPLRDEDLEADSEIIPSPPPTGGRLEIIVDKEAIKRVDLTAAHDVLRPYVSQVGDNVGESRKDPRELMERSVGFTINYEREDPLDPRELSELSDVRIWFVRLDDAYPWLPAVLDWRGGELARYTAMLVPHQMTRRTGLVFNPEALEIFSLRKYFTVYEWMRARGLPRPDSRVKDMMKVLGFSIDDALYTIMEQSPPPA